MALFTGTTGKDKLTGGNANDIINGLAGNDTLSGGGGIDLISGGTGNDILNGNAGNDKLNGGTGNDKLNGGTGDDTLNGGAGLDAMNGGAGKDTYFVDSTGDTVSEGASAGIGDKISASITIDLANFLQIEDVVLTGSAGINATGSASNNSLTGNAGGNVLNGRAGNDKLSGGGGGDVLSGGADNDTMAGGDGDDILFGGTGNDTQSAGNGDDALRGDDGDDTLSGGEGIDNIAGGAGADLVTSGPGADAIALTSDLVLTDTYFYKAGDLGSIDQIFGTFDNGKSTTFELGDDIIDISDLITLSANAATNNISDFISGTTDGLTGWNYFIDLDGGGTDFGGIQFLHFVDDPGRVGFRDITNGVTTYHET